MRSQPFVILCFFLCKSSPYWAPDSFPHAFSPLKVFIELLLHIHFLPVVFRAFKEDPSFLLQEFPVLSHALHHVIFFLVHMGEKFARLLLNFLFFFFELEVVFLYLRSFFLNPFPSFFQYFLHSFTILPRPTWLIAALLFSLALNLLYSFIEGFKLWLICLILHLQEDYKLFQPQDFSLSLRVQVIELLVEWNLLLHIPLFKTPDSVKKEESEKNVGCYDQEDSDNQASSVGWRGILPFSLVNWHG